MRVLFYLGGGLGNIVHATPAIEAIRRTPHDLTVWVGGEWDGLAKFIDHDAVVTGDPPEPSGFDRTFASPLAFSGSDSHWGPKYGPQAEWSGIPLDPGRTEAEANFWFARVLGFDGPMPPPRVRHATDAPVEGEDGYIVIAPGVQRASVVWASKQYPHFLEVARALSQVNRLHEADEAKLDNSGPGSDNDPGSRDSEDTR